MNGHIKRKWQHVAARLDTRQEWQRTVIFVCTMALLLAAALWVIFPPLWSLQDQRREDITRTQNETKALQDEITRLAAELRQDPEDAARARLTSLEQQARQADGPLHAMQSGLVSPREMVDMVRDIVARKDRVQVIGVENLPPEAMPAPEDSDSTFYRHGARIRVQGSYPALVGFLQELETQPRKVLWGEVQLETANYPASVLTVVIYTLSLDAAWIGT